VSEYRRILDECLVKLQERDEIYQSCWRLLSKDEILRLVKYKLFRYSHCLDRRKRIDDLEDAINFLVFLIIKEEGGD